MEHKLALNKLMQVAKQAVDLKREHLEREMRRKVSKEVYVRQLEETEASVADKVAVVIDAQVRAIIDGLLELLIDEKSHQEQANSLVHQTIRPVDWKDELINAALPPLAVGMLKAMAAGMVVYGIDPRLKSVKASTASEWVFTRPGVVQDLGELFMGLEDFPIRLWTEMPEWMKQEIAAQLTESFSEPYWEEIAKTTMRDAEDALRAGLDQGWSIRKIADEMRESLGGGQYAKNRAMNIARTESGHALNGARKAASDRLKRDLPPLGIRRVWLSVLGTTTRDSHASLDGVPEDSDGMWLLSGVRVPWPGHIKLPPGERCNCMCTTVDEFGMSNDESQQLIHDYYNREESNLGKSFVGWVWEKDRASRARNSHKPSTQSKQRRAYKEQRRLARIVQGTELEWGAPFDIRCGNQVIEVKTIIDNKNNKVTVHPDSKVRKEEYAKKKGYSMHLVAIDVRGKARKYYYHKGIGSFLLSAMKVVTPADLKRLFGAVKTLKFNPNHGPDGRFTSGSGGGAHMAPDTGGGTGGGRSSSSSTMAECKRGKDGKLTMSDGSPLPDHIPKNIPPAWKNVKVASDPKAELLVTGTDKKGRRQSVYSQAHWEESAKRKFSRTSELLKKERAINKELQRDARSEAKREEASCLMLIQHTGIRPGGTGNTKADKKAYGATTLEGRHVHVDGKGNVTLKFTGKKGVDLEIPVTDKTVASDLKQRKKAAGNDGRLFSTASRKLSKYSHSKDGGGFKTKDFRTARGTSTATQMVKSMPKPTTQKEYKQAVKQVAEAVSKQLGNTPTVALQSYIDPMVFSGWRVE